MDDSGPTTVRKDQGGNYTIIDQAGHTTKLSFTKTYSGRRLTYAKLTGVQYDTEPKVTLPSTSFVYLWDAKTPSILLSQTIAIDKTSVIQAVYNKTTNKTTIIVLNKNIPIEVKTFSGLKIVRLLTDGGVVGYGW